MNPEGNDSEYKSSHRPSGSLRRHWLQGAGFGVVLQGGGMMFAFASSVLVARILGPEGLGEYSFVLAVVAVLSVLAALGLPTVVARLLAAYQTNEEWGAARGILRWSNSLVGAVAVSLGVGFAIIGTLWQGGNQQCLFLLAAPLIAVLAWANLRQRALQGLHRPLAAQLPEQFIKHTVFLTVTGVFWFAGYEFITRSEGVMAVWLFAGLLNLAFGIVLLRRFSPVRLRNAAPTYEPRNWLSIAFPLFAADALGVVLLNTDTIMLGWLRSSSEVGVYQVALRGANLMLAILSASNWVLSPWFARFHATGENDRMQHIVTRTTRLIFLVTLIAYLILVFWGKQLLGFFFGNEFIHAYPLLLILGIGQLVNVASGPVVSLLAMTGRQKELAWSVAAAVTVNFVLCLLLIPPLGPMGAAISVASSISAFNVALAIVTKRCTGLGATILG